MSPRARLLLWLIGALGVLGLALWLVAGREDAGKVEGTDTLGSAETGLLPTGATLTGRESEPPASAQPEGQVHAAELKPWPVGKPGDEGPGEGQVYVLLVDGHGTPLASHPIEVSWWLRFSVSGADTGRTDAEGRFRTSASEVWQIESVSVPTAAELENVQLYHSGPFAAHPERALEVRVEVPLPGLIRGRVTDLENKPVAATLSCHPRRLLSLDPFTFPMGIDERELKVSRDGSFRIPVVTGKYSLQCDDATSSVSVSITKERPVVEVHFVQAQPAPPGELSVTVLGVPEEARPKIRLLARTVEPAYGLPTNTPGAEHNRQALSVRPTRLASNRFRFDGLVGAGWKISASAPGMEGQVVEVAPGASELDITLREATPAVKRIVRIVGRLPSGKTVRPHIDKRFSLDGGRQSDHGDYYGPKDPHAEGSPVELYRDKTTWLIVSYPGMGYTGIGPIPADSLLKRIEVPLESKQEATVSFVDKAGRPLACTTSLFPTWRAFHEPLPSGGTRMGTRSGYAPFGMSVHRASSDDGSKTFSWLPSAPFAVQAVPKDAGHTIAFGEVRAGEHLRLVEGQGAGERMSIDVIIVDAQTAGPIPGASIRVYAENLPPVEEQPEGKTDAQGSLTLTGLVAGPTHLYIKAHGYAHPATLLLDPSMVDAPIEVRLHRKRLLPLRIVENDERPVESAEVRARRSDGTLVTLQDEYGNWDGEEIWTDGAGRADLAGLPPLRLTLEVLREGSKKVHSFEVDLRQPPRELLTLTLPAREAR